MQPVAIQKDVGLFAGFCAVEMETALAYSKNEFGQINT